MEVLIVVVIVVVLSVSLVYLAYALSNFVSSLLEFAKKRSSLKPAKVIAQTSLSAMQVDLVSSAPSARLWPQTARLARSQLLLPSDRGGFHMCAQPVFRWASYSRPIRVISVQWSGAYVLWRVVPTCYFPLYVQ